MFANNLPPNITQLTGVFQAVQNTASPILQILDSTSFIEANKLAISNIADILLKPPQEGRNRPAKTFSFFKETTLFITSRLNYILLVCKAIFDLIIVTFKALSSILFLILVPSLKPSKHLKHIGIALFTIFNGTLGIVIPKFASRNQLVFSITVLGVAGRDVKEKIRRLMTEIENGLEVNPR